MPPVLHPYQISSSERSPSAQGHLCCGSVMFPTSLFLILSLPLFSPPSITRSSSQHHSCLTSFSKSGQPYPMCLSSAIKVPDCRGLTKKKEAQFDKRFAVVYCCCCCWCWGGGNREGGNAVSDPVDLALDQHQSSRRTVKPHSLVIPGNII